MQRRFLFLLRILANIQSNTKFLLSSILKSTLALVPKPYFTKAVALKILNCNSITFNWKRIFAPLWFHGVCSRVMGGKRTRNTPILYGKKYPNTVSYTCVMCGTGEMPECGFPFWHSRVRIGAANLPCNLRRGKMLWVIYVCDEPSVNPCPYLNTMIGAVGGGGVVSRVDRWWVVWALIRIINIISCEFVVS